MYCVCVCVCVRERQKGWVEGGREAGREEGRKGERENKDMYYYINVCLDTKCIVPYFHCEYKMDFSLQYVKVYGLTTILPPVVAIGYPQTTCTCIWYQKSRPGWFEQSVSISSNVLCAFCVCGLSNYSVLYQKVYSGIAHHFFQYCPSLYNKYLNFDINNNATTPLLGAY